jgi:hypothetical protein
VSGQFAALVAHAKYYGARMTSFSEKLAQKDRSLPTHLPKNETVNSQDRINR